VSRSSPPTWHQGSLRPIKSSTNKSSSWPELNQLHKAHKSNLTVQPSYFTPKTNPHPKHKTNQHKKDFKGYKPVPDSLRAAWASYSRWSDHDSQEVIQQKHRHKTRNMSFSSPLSPQQLAHSDWSFFLDPKLKLGLF